MIGRGPRIVGPAFALLALAALVVSIARPDDEGRTALHRIAAADATTTVPVTETTAAPTPAGRTSAGQPSATTSVSPCEQSFDPACGPQQWLPDPGADRPLTARVVSYSPANPGPDEPVTYTVRIEDPDAALTSDDVYFGLFQCCRLEFSYGSVYAHEAERCAKRSKPFGSWRTPGRRAGSIEVTRTFAYTTAYPTVEYVEVASDLCSFVTYADGEYSTALREYQHEVERNRNATFRDTPYFNPYASHAAWEVCIESDGVRLIPWRDQSESCQHRWASADATTTTTTTTVVPVPVPGG